MGGWAQVRTASYQASVGSHHVSGTCASRLTPRSSTPHEKRKGRRPPGAVLSMRLAEKRKGRRPPGTVWGMRLAEKRNGHRHPRTVLGPVAAEASGITCEGPRRFEREGVGPTLGSRERSWAREGRRPHAWLAGAFLDSTKRPIVATIHSLLSILSIGYFIIYFKCQSCSLVYLRVHVGIGVPSHLRKRDHQEARGP